MNLNTLKKEEAMAKLEQGATIEYSAWYNVANLMLNGEIVGRLHIATFNSLAVKKVIVKTGAKGDEFYYALNSNQSDISLCPSGEKKTDSLQLTGEKHE